MTFQTKKDGWISILIWAAVILPILMLVMRGDAPWLSIIIFGGTTVVLLWVWFGTFYTLEDEVLKFRVGPIKGEVWIEGIDKIIKDSKESLNGGGLSFDRMSIIYDKSKQVTISPENKEELIKELLVKNPDIKVIEADR